VIGKRLLDIVVAVFGLLLAAPILILIAVAIRVDTRGPAFFRQERVGRAGRIFRIHKFRTMHVDGELSALPLTVGNDARITRVGRWLRRCKLDELPQLIDVLVGDMSIVGPRPEVPRFVARWPADVRAIVLSVRPGITDEASLEFIDESALLSGTEDPEREYLERILPRKLDHYVHYVRHRTLAGDCAIVLRTVSRVIAG
jgi:lipopolysaccharide/colanic/teichoic acid biosynthesis glycosyltransferase